MTTPEKYQLTDAHRARLPEFTEYGIKLALRTEPQTPAEQRRAIAAVADMYRLIDLPAPRVVFAPSPLVARFAAGFAAWVWYEREQGREVLNTDTRNVLGTAALSTYRTVYEACALEVPNIDAMPTALMPAVPDDCTTWWAGLPDMVQIADDLGVGQPGLECAAKAHRLQQWGNAWAGPVARTEFFRQVAQLDIDWAPWLPWLALAETGGYRYMHKQFVIISDFPTLIKQDSANRPHCADGPFTKWSDGTALYAWHGVYTPQWVIEHPERIDVASIKAETNAEVRRIMIERYGMGRYLEQSGAVPISSATDEGGQLMHLYDVDGIRRLRLRNSTTDPDGSVREYILRVPGRFDDVWAARNWTCHIDDPDVRFERVS